MTLPAATLRTLLAAALALALAGCSASKAERLGCPRAVILEEAAFLSEFEPGSARAPEDLRYRSEIAEVASHCAYDGDEVVVALDLAVTARLGPAAPARALAPRYFVAVTRRDSDVLAKEVFPLDLRFPAEGEVALARDAVKGIRIPLAEGETALDYEVLVGFDLAVEDVNHNRERLAR